MLFNSLTFVVFFALVLLFHNLPFSWRTKKVFLLVASYAFYAAWNPAFVALLWLSTLVDWYVANALFRSEGLGRRRALLSLSVMVNLGILGFFKYGGFLLDNFVALVGLFGITYQPAVSDIILPVGISFYTFQTMAYSMDMYLKRAEPARSFLDFALFVTFFPQLVAGPIVRPTHLIPQFAEPRRASSKQLLWGLGLMTLGLFDKVVVADGLFSTTSDKVFGSGDPMPVIDAWLGTLAFSGQIFCDFAGYSTAAIGAALCLGFSLPNNFLFPYAAIGFSDFWRRWHISLSTWLRDYLYIPLGGNRKGARRTYINLMLTMLLGGLWHGAAWTFIAWGGLHGFYLMAERFLQRRFGDPERTTGLAHQIFVGFVTYFLVNIAWVFFRAQDFETAWLVLTSMFGLAGEGQPVLATIYMIETAVATLVLVGVHWYMRYKTLEEVVGRLHWFVVAFVWAFMLFAIIATQGTGSAFIYFQF